MKDEQRVNKNIDSSALAKFGNAAILLPIIKIRIVEKNLYKILISGWSFGLHSFLWLRFFSRLFFEYFRQKLSLLCFLISYLF